MHRSDARTRASQWLARLALLALVITLAPLTLLSATNPAASADPAPLSVGVTASSDPVGSGSQLTWSIEVRNTGGAAVDEVRVTDQVNGLTGVVLTTTAGSCGQTANLVTCEAGTLAGGDVFSVTIRGVVTGSNGTTLHNTATATGTHASTTFTVTATASALISNAPSGPLPDLALSIVAPSSVAPSSPVTYQLVVNNVGTLNADEIRLVDTLPAGFGFTSVAGSSLFDCGFSGGTVTCTGGAVNAGANATVTIQAVSPAGGGTFVNTAAVDPNNDLVELNDLNNAASATTTVATPPAQPNTLSITKTGSANPVKPGGTLTYTINVVNNAATRADSVAVTDGTQGMDAASVQATSTRGACTISASKVTCTQTSPTLRLNPGESMTVTVTGTVVATAGSVIANTATVTGNIKNTGVTKTASVTTSVRPGVDLTVTQHAVCGLSCPFRADAPYSYVITVGNSGLDDASGVVVREPLPAGVDFVGFSTTGGFACAAAGGIVTCTGGLVPGVTTSGLPGGATRTITLNLIAPPQVGTISATVTVDPDNAIFESDETNNTATTTTLIQTGIDLTVSQTVNFDPVAPSGTLIYTITVRNIGTQDTAGVLVRDTLPAGSRFRVAAGDHNFTCGHDGSATGGTVTCQSGILAGTHGVGDPVDTATITITLFAPAAPGSITNTVRVDPDNAIAEIDETNNINSLTSAVAIGGGGVFNELHVTGITDVPDPVAPSGVLTYTITVENTGSDPASNLRVRDNLPAGSSFRFANASPLSAGNGGFTCSEASLIVECTGGSLASGGTATIEISVFAPADPGTYTNQAIVDPGNDVPEADETNNVATVQTTVALGGGGSFVDLRISAMTDTPDPVTPGGTLTYALTLRNDGTQVAFNVAARDTLPAGTTFVSANGTNGFLCAEAGGVVNCTNGTLSGGGGTATITIVVHAPLQHGISVTNQATVDPDNAIAEADESNNAAQAITGVQSQIDLTVTNSAPGSASQNGTFDYTVTVTNGGTAQANGVDLHVDLPVGVIVLNMNPTGNFGCQVQQNPVNVVDCTGDLAGGANAVVTITVFVTADSGTAMVSTATVDPNAEIVESNEANNTSLVTTTVS